MEARTKMATAAGWALYLLGVVVLEGLLLASTGGEIAQLTLVASTLLFAALLRPLGGRLSCYFDRRLKERLALRAALEDPKGPHTAKEHRNSENTPSTHSGE